VTGSPSVRGTGTNASPITNEGGDALRISALCYTQTSRLRASTQDRPPRTRAHRLLTGAIELRSPGSRSRVR